MKGKFPMIGISSLLVIFAVLCLTVFALLSLNTATSATKLSTLSAENTAAYYNADCKANEILASLRNGEIPSGVTLENGVYSYSCKISETQVLEVSVIVNSSSDYTVLRWQSVFAGDWENDTGIEVWDGIF